MLGSALAAKSEWNRWLRWASDGERHHCVAGLMSGLSRERSEGR